MADDPPSGSRIANKSVKDFASTVFKESSVTAVSAIVSTGSVPRKVFRILVFALFTVGFLYQCIKFLNYILGYPTVVNLEILKPQRFLTPGYTFCNYNTIKRSKFCRKYPEKCDVANPGICMKFPHYCGKENETLIPKEKYFTSHEIPEDEILTFGHDLEDMMVHSKGEGVEQAQGPFPRIRVQEQHENHISGCFSLHGRVDSDLDPLMTESQKWWVDVNHEYQLNPEEYEVFNPNSQPGFLFSIHSPFDAVNPFQKGIFMKPGHTYMITITMQEEELLPYPYKTDCVNYTEMWVKSTRSGPRSQEMCRYVCTLHLSRVCLNCIHPSILYPSNETICQFNVNASEECENEDSLPFRNYESCQNKCKDDCLRLKYIYEVQEYSRPKEIINNSIDWKSRNIIIKIEFESSEIVSLHYRPQYQEVEAFSYIGGFIGIWLGVSLVQVADIFESVFRILRYIFSKGTSVCSKKVASLPDQQPV